MMSNKEYIVCEVVNGKNHFISVLDSVVTESVVEQPFDFSVSGLEEFSVYSDVTLEEVVEVWNIIKTSRGV